MYLYKQPRKNGDLYLSIKEKYHVPKVGPRERTIESIGLLSELKKTISDPIAYYTKYAEELTKKAKAERSQTITINKDEKLDTSCFI